MLIEIRSPHGAAYIVDPERLLVPRPGSRAARAWFERGPLSARRTPPAAAAWDGAQVPLDRPSPATARRSWVVIPGGA